MSILRGPKFGNTHQTFIPDLLPILDQLKQSNSVKKIILGHVAPCCPGLARLKLQDISGALLSFSFRGKTAIQQIAVTCEDNQSAIDTWDALLAEFPIPTVHPKFSRTEKETKPLLKTKLVVKSSKSNINGEKAYQNLIDELRSRRAVLKIVEGIKKKSRNKKREIIIIKEQDYQFPLVCKFIDHEWHRSFHIILNDRIQKELIKNYILSIKNI